MNTVMPWFKKLVYILLLLPLVASSCYQRSGLYNKDDKSQDNFYTQLSATLLVKVKSDKNVEEILKKLANLSEDSLASSLVTDQQKKAFWINIYNAHIQYFLKDDPSLFDNRGAFFSSPRVRIAQKTLSFDDIEHGIIRGSKFKLALGLIKNPFANAYEKKFRVDKTDGRIHFALNCGAKSCPRVAIYYAENFDDKIDAVAQSFLKDVCQYKADENTVYLTPLFSWFRGDFGSKRNIYELLSSYQVIPEGSKPNIKYLDYDWTLSLNNYYEAK